MRVRSNLFLVIVGLLAALVWSACSEPTKPIKKLNIRKASDYEPIAAPVTSTETSTEATSTAAPPNTSTAPPAEAMEIVEVQGYKGSCDHVFVGINDDGLATLRSASQVRTFRLAGISIPEAVKLEAHNQIRIWLDKRNVSVEIDDSVPAVDPGAYLHLCPDGFQVNLELVREGLAVPAEQRYKRTDELKKASVEALTAGRGVWGRSSR